MYPFFVFDPACLFCIIYLDAYPLQAAYIVIDDALVVYARKTPSLVQISMHTFLLEI